MVDVTCFVCGHYIDIDVDGPPEMRRPEAPNRAWHRRCRFGAHALIEFAAIAAAASR